MRNRRINLLVLGLLVPTLLWAANTTINRVPSTSGSGAATYQTDLDVFLRQEDANRQGELPLFPQGVVAQNGGGRHGTAASMTSPPFATTAYTAAGNRLQQASTSINYAGQACAPSSTAWVIASGQTQATVGTFLRVPGTIYYTDCSSGPAALPPLPPDSLTLMKVTISGAQLIVVEDLAVRAVVPLQDPCLGISTVQPPVVGLVVDSTAGGVTVLTANMQRCQALIQNTGTAPMSCAPLPTVVTAAVGVLVQGGQTLEMGVEGQQQWNCIRTTGTSTTVTRVETLVN